MEIDPNKAIRYIQEMAPTFAKAKGTRVRLEEFRKSKKAELMLQAPTEVLGKQETFAYSHPDYLAVLDDLEKAVTIEEEVRWMLIAAQARIEVWKTQQYNARAEMKAFS
jgi:DNA-binding transcriptional regulator/RsmH inhibitor MraZ